MRRRKATMQQISIIGFGRFGKTLYRLLKDDFAVVLYSRSGIKAAEGELGKNTTVTTDLREVYASDGIFYAVPISQFETVIAEHRQYFEPRHLLLLHIHRCGPVPAHRFFHSPSNLRGSGQIPDRASPELPHWHRLC